MIRRPWPANMPQPPWPKSSARCCRTPLLPRKSPMKRAWRRRSPRTGETAGIVDGGTAGIERSIDWAQQAPADMFAWLMRRGPIESGWHQDDRLRLTSTLFEYLDRQRPGSRLGCRGQNPQPRHARAGADFLARSAVPERSRPCAGLAAAESRAVPAGSRSILVPGLRRGQGAMRNAACLATKRGADASARQDARSNGRLAAR